MHIIIVVSSVVWMGHPLLISWLCCVAVVVLLTTVIGKLVQQLRERFDGRLQQLQALKLRMQNAANFAEWKDLAKQVDELEGFDPRDAQLRWRQETKMYDKKLLTQKLAHLRKVKETGNVRELMFALRSDLIRNVGNIASRY
jgi:TAG lipase / steryl ester hydrolase / phospholipase A2 / LPA acyltransferase